MAISIVIPKKLCVCVSVIRSYAGSFADSVDQHLISQGDQKGQM